MNRKATASFVCVIIGIVSLTCMCDKPGATGGKPVSMEKTESRFSYAIGLEIGTSLREMPASIEFDALKRGIRDALEAKETLLSPEEAEQIKREVFTGMQQQRQEQQGALSEKNKKAQEEFLAKNKNESGVKTTASGLQYQVLRDGAGQPPKGADRVSVHYKGTLPGGDVFDNSYDRNEPATFSVSALIPGWSEGLQLMKEGGKYKLWIPSALAYGERGAGDKIGPNEMLTFEVELLKINPVENKMQVVQ